VSVVAVARRAGACWPARAIRVRSPARTPHPENPRPRTGCDYRAWCIYLACLSRPGGRACLGMADPEPRTDGIADGEPTLASGQAPVVAAVSGPTATGAAALAAAQGLASKAAAPATRRAYKADWVHYAAWCANAGLAPVPAEPAIVGAYLASLAETHACAAGCPPSARCTASTTCPGTLPTATSRGRCRDCCASTAGQCGRPPPSRSPCCAGSSPPATHRRADGATAPCC